MPYGFRQEDLFIFFPYIISCKTCDPGAGPLLAQELNLNKLGRAPLGDMLHTKYQGSGPCGYRQEDLLMFPNISLC